MDIKIAGITEEIMKVALEQAKDGRMHILGEMAKALRPRAELGEFAPRIETIKIPTDKIREVIGTGGKVIREIVEKTGAKINIEDDGTVKIASANGKEIEAAIKWIKSITAEPEVGEIYEGTVVKTADFGAFVNFFGARRTASSISPARRQPRRQDHRRGQGRRQGVGQAARLRRARQGPPVDEGRRPGDRLDEVGGLGAFERVADLLGGGVRLADGRFSRIERANSIGS
jgi:polyribonucleotide nucleotidyltransferase